MTSLSSFNETIDSLFLSSLVFSTNFVAALSKGKIEYAYAFFFLTFTSLLVHGIFYCIPILLIDKFAILQIVLIGGYYFYEQIGVSSLPHLIAIVSTFIAVIILYCYGYFTNQLCFDPDKQYGNFCHAIMHIVGSLGHHLIIAGS
jgi:hypothetical protein